MYRDAQGQEHLLPADSAAYSADTPGSIGANNNMPMGTTKYCDTILACAFHKSLCYEMGLALARDAAASVENGISYFYAPGSNLHRSCLSGRVTVL